jgi:hypothetical protein
MSIDRYNSISKSSREFKLPSIVSFIPTPNDKNYQNGYIVRYFVQKANDTSSPIYELNRNSYNRILDTPFYTTVSLDWRLTGSNEDVKKSNSASIRIASETIPKIQLYLPNLLQFHKK